MQHWGFPDVHRTAQTSAKVSGADLGGTGNLHVEVKLRKSLAVEAFLEQSIRDARPGKTPIVVMRRDRGEWLVMFRLSDTESFIKEVGGQNEAKRGTEK